MRMLALLALLAVWPSTAWGDRAAAKKITDRAVKEHYKLGHWREALTAYQLALAEDQTFAKLHYYIASAASIIGDFDRAHEALLSVANASDEGDKEAKRLLKLARTDPDLDRASADARVRALISLPPIESLGVDQVLLERKGIWSVEYVVCGWESVTLSFKKGGKLTCTTVTTCNDPVGKPSCSGTWKAEADGSVKLTFKRPPDVDKELDLSVLQPCAGKTGCFQLLDGTIVHRGKADLDQVDPSQSDP